MLRTVDDIKDALKVRGAPKPGSKANKPQLIEMAQIYIPDVPIWEAIVAEEHEKAEGRTVISAADWAELEIMYECARRVPDLRELFITPKVRLPEISVFFYSEPIPGKGPVLCRFRFDGLYPMVTGDLKVVSSLRSFMDEVSYRMSEWKYRLQAGWSFYARRMAYDQILAGRVFGGRRLNLSINCEEASLEELTLTGLTNCL